LNINGRAPVDEAALRRMNGLLRHRGPDDDGFLLEGPLGLAMRRFSIIALAGGRQPVSNEDGSVTLVFNGEIYNYRELAAALKARGHKFSTASDTEVIAHLYEEEGENCVKKLRGMFAFALRDKKRGRLVLARDRLGKKPLYYCHKDGRLAFASELEALVSLDFVSREVDLRALDHYLGLQYIPAPFSIYKDVRKLPPAHTLAADAAGIKLSRYWSLNAERAEFSGTFDEAKTAVREKLEEAVRLRLEADVPLGAFLSGGVDSSAVVALMAAQSSGPVRTFCVGFEEAEFSELPYAREVAQRYSTRHTEIIVRPGIEDDLPLIARRYGEPFADSSAVPSYYVARETVRHVKVALSGDGGDESFGGYPRYHEIARLAWLDSLPGAAKKAVRALSELVPADSGGPGALSKLKRFAAGFDRPFHQRYFGTLAHFDEADKSRLYNAQTAAELGGDFTEPRRWIESFFRGAARLDTANKLMYCDFNSYLPHCLMAKMDIASMANSLEARSPFMDQELIELAFSLPGGYKLSGSRGKHVLKEAVRDLLPESVLDREKKGFGLPAADWLGGRLRGYWEGMVLSDKAELRRWLNQDYIREIQAEHLAGRKNNGRLLWSLLMLELWARENLR